MQRQPVVAGRFYDADPDKLMSVVDGCLALAEEKREAKTLLAMAPHAGYIFSGGVCGKTLGMANLESTILLLGPNHTGRGTPFSLWSEGQWDFPGGSLAVDGPLADQVLGAHPAIVPDTDAHVGEHSLEVIVPFLHRLNPETTIVPIAIAASHLDDLKSVGESIGRMLKDYERPVSIVVSSDMSHMVSDEEAERLDTMALEPALRLDPATMFNTVREHNISMCGVRPMTVGLYAALEMGATKAELTGYANSGAVTGDYAQVVGYAGVLVS